MHISSVIKISFCRISFSGHQNKFCACLDSIYGSRVILVMCKNCSDIRWHRLNSNQSKTNCPKNLNSDGLIVREMGPWPECIFRSLLQFLVTCLFLLHIWQWQLDSGLDSWFDRLLYFQKCVNHVANVGFISTHWGLDEMNNISQTTFSNEFSSMKMSEFRLKFHWSLFPRVQSTIFQHGFR